MEPNSQPLCVHRVSFESFARCRSRPRALRLPPRRDEAAAFGVPVARRMSSQLVKRNLGLVLGYQVRSDQHMSARTRPPAPLRVGPVHGSKI